MKPHMTLKSYLVLSALAPLLLSRLASAQGNLVYNGGFDTDASGWTIINDIRGYDGKNGNPLGDLALGSFPLSSAPSTASQTINSLTPGFIYTVLGDYQKIADEGGGSATDYSFGVAMDGTFLFETADPGDFNWHSFNFSYTATSSSVVLSLSSQLNATPFAYAIDNIAMYAIPEPASLCLISIGGIVGALLFRNLRKSLL